MGVFHVPVKLRNWQNKFLPKDKRGQDVQWMPSWIQAPPNWPFLPI
jgi:hypothetical protein